MKAFYINYDEENLNILKVPHITASLANNAKASNTKNLKFIPLENPVKLVGRFGYWIKDEDNEYVSYEIYSNKRTK